MIQPFRDLLPGEDERTYSLLKAEHEGVEREKIKNSREQSVVSESPITKFKRNFDCNNDSSATNQNEGPT